MKWTRTPPSGEGWYWLREGKYVRVVRVHRYWHPGELVVNGRDVSKYAGHEWSGPIPEPEEGE